MNASEPASYAPSWYTATMVPTAMRGPLTFDLDVDVCVIGAGLAGLTTAREIARRGWSVAVLEAGRIAGNASGRNDGFVLPGFAESMERVVSRVGMEHAKALWDLSEMGLRLRAHHHRRGPDAGRRADCRLAQSLQGRQRR